MKPSRLLSVVVAAPLLGPFALGTCFGAPLAILLVTIALLVGTAAGVAALALLALCWLAFTIGGGFLMIDPVAPGYLRGLSLYSWPLRERRAFVAIGLVPPIAFLAGTQLLSLNAVVNWLVSLAIASVVAGIIFGLAAAAQASEFDSVVRGP